MNGAGRCWFPGSCSRRACQNSRPTPGEQEGEKYLLAEGGRGSLKEDGRVLVFAPLVDAGVCCQSACN